MEESGLDDQHQAPNSRSTRWSIPIHGCFCVGLLGEFDLVKVQMLAKSDYGHGQKCQNVLTTRISWQRTGVVIGGYDSTGFGGIKSFDQR